MDRDDDDVEPGVYVQHGFALPSDAERMGLDRNTEEGALIAMMGALSPQKLGHRIVAWVLLGVFSLPLLYTLIHTLF